MGFFVFQLLNIKELFIFHPNQIFSLHFFNNFVFNIQNFKHVFSKNQKISVRQFNFDVIYFFSDGKCNVSGQCPRSCRPGKKIFVVFSLDFEGNINGIFFDIFVSESHFVA